MIKFDFSNKVVLVVAGAKGIGFGIAEAFCKAGANVCICSRDELNVASAFQALSDLGQGQVLALSGDIGELGFLESLVEKTEEHFGNSIDILVNNSGGPPAKAAIDIKENDWSKAIDRNLMSAIRLSMLVTSGMKKKAWGRIINLTSVTAREPAAGMALSNVTRTGVASYSKTLARELGPNGITVNTILTGGVKTKRFYNLAKGQAERTGITLEKTVESMEENSPVRYISSPEEFAHTILFIASEEAGYLTGTAVALDGGSSSSIF